MRIIDPNIISELDDSLAFISSWDTTNTTGSDTDSDQIALPLRASQVIDITVSWGDGIIENFTDSDDVGLIHTYLTEGVKTIKIWNNLGVGNIFFTFNYAPNGRKDKKKILDISQFGDIQIYQTSSSEIRTFWTCTNLEVTAEDVYERCISLTTYGFDLFYGTAITTLYNSTNWDMSHFTTMYQMFFSCASLALDCSGWNMNGVDSIQGIFASSGTYNPDVESWDTSTITTYAGAFQTLTSFNRDLSGWDVSSGVNFQALFSSCTSFVGTGLDSWNADTGLVTTFQSTFQACAALDFSKVEGWDMSSATTLYRMFYNNNSSTNAATADFTSWNVSNVTNFDGFIGLCDYANPDITGWTLKAASSINIDNMFYQAFSFNRSLNGWTNTDSITSMSWTFFLASVYDQSMSNWDVSNVTDMNGCFRQSAFNQDVSSFDVSSVLDLSTCFYLNTDFEGDGLDSWNVSSCTNFVNFGYLSGITTANYDKMVLKWTELVLQPSEHLDMDGIEYTGCVLSTGSATATTSSRLEDSTADFSNVMVNDIINNKTDDTYTKVTAIDSSTVLLLNNDIMTSGDTYNVETSEVAKWKEYVLNVRGWTIDDAGPSTSSCALNTYIGGESARWPSASALLNAFDIIGSGSHSFLYYRTTGSNIEANIIDDYGLDQLTFHDVSEVTYYYDFDGRMITWEQGNFDNTPNVEAVHVPGVVSTNAVSGYFILSSVSSSFYPWHRFESLTSIGNGFKGAASLTHLDLRSVDTVYIQSFGRFVLHNLTNMERLYLGNFTTKNGYVGTSGSNFITNIGISSSIYVHTTMSTFTSGGLQQDLLYAQEQRGSDIIFVDNYTGSSAITDLTASNITSTTATLTFSEPSSFNSMSFYEVWIDDGSTLDYKAFPYTEITASGAVITGLTPSSSVQYKLVGCDIYWNRSEFSNVVSASHPPVSPFEDAYWYYALAQEWNWSNAILWVRRDSDDAHAYIFFDENGKVSNTSSISTTSNTIPTTASLIDWAGTGSTYVRTWFSQNIENDISDVNNTIAQATTTSQPILISSGSLETLNGETCMLFSSSFIGNALEPPSYGNGNENTSICVLNQEGPDFSHILSVQQSSNFWGILMYSDRTTNKFISRLRTSGTHGGSDLFAQEDNTNQRIQTMITHTSSAEVTNYFNGTNLSSSAYTGTWNSAWFFMGKDKNNTKTSHFKIQAYACWASDKSDEIDEIHTTLNNYYGTY